MTYEAYDLDTSTIDSIFEQHIDSRNFEQMYLDMQAAGFSKLHLHRAYYRNTHKLGPNIDLEHCTAYQKFCGAHLDYNAAPSLREAVASEKEPKPKEKPENNNELYDYRLQLVAGISSKKSANNIKANWTTERFVEHIFYHLAPNGSKLYKTTSYESQLAALQSMTTMEIK